MTAGEYDIRVKALKQYCLSKISGGNASEVITGEVTDKDVELILADFKTISDWLDERMKVEEIYYYDDAEFETEVSPQLLWSE